MSLTVAASGFSTYEAGDFFDLSVGRRSCDGHNVAEPANSTE